MVFERGQRSVDFFLVLDGTIEIFETGARGHQNILPSTTPDNLRER